MPLLRTHNMLHPRRSCAFKAILFCWLFLGVGRADPLPDFAINAVISGSSTVSSIALETKAFFVDVAGPTVLLQSGYTRIERALAALTSIAGQLSTTGVTLTQAISTMSLNKNGPIATYFDPISAAITKLQRLITTDLTGQLTNLTAEIDHYVKDNFLDSFKALGPTLVTLSQAVTNLRTAVTSARAASGTAVTVSPNDVKKFVTTRVISDITNGVRLLRTNVPILVYIVKSTLSSFQSADQYLVGLVQEAMQREQDVIALGVSNTADVNASVTTVTQSLTTELNGPYSRLTQLYRTKLQVTVEANATFKAMVDGWLNDTAPLFDNVDIGGKLETIYSTYVQQVLALDDDLAAFYGSSMCSLVYHLLQSLIENGPYAQFCFSKYGQKVFNFFVLHATDVEDCYRLQMTRLDKLVPALLNIVKLMVHDIDDFAVHVERCTQFKNLQNCVPYLGAEYKTLLGYTATKRDYLYRLATKETNGSYYRLAGCYHNGEHIMLLNAEEMKIEIDKCKINGPTVV
ncbi:uncharacterized protein LOC133393599 [Anopheles gambiae]|uniref:uncharacterized protein LOC133393599 n=1 Tax=Anopheles gambiae TaxID=7165 RepID=UPI002AC90E90|nr:uncharacterized protein LOC133393599 [Anopheles gambiae]